VTKRKPVEGPCETIIGWDHQYGYDRMPVGIKCHRPGVLRMEFLFPFGVILCDNCYQMQKEKSHTLPLASDGEDA
jgi:hypothetical protein